MNVGIQAGTAPCPLIKKDMQREEGKIWNPGEADGLRLKKKRRKLLFAEVGHEKNKSCTFGFI